MKINFFKKNFPDATEQWFQETENKLKKLFSGSLHFQYEESGRQIFTLSLRGDGVLYPGIHSFKKTITRKVILDKKINLDGEFFTIQVKNIFFFNEAILFVDGAIENQDGYELSEPKLQIKRFVIFDSDKPVLIQDRSAVVRTAKPNSPFGTEHQVSDVPTEMNTSPEEWAKYLKFLAKCKRQENLIAKGYTSRGWFGNFYLLRSEVVEETYEPVCSGIFNPEELVQIRISNTAKGYCINNNTLFVGKIKLPNTHVFTEIISYEIEEESISKEIFSEKVKVNGVSTDDHWRGMPFTGTKNSYFRYKSQKIRIKTKYGDFVIDITNKISV